MCCSPASALVGGAFTGWQKEDGAAVSGFVFNLFTICIYTHARNVQDICKVLCANAGKIRWEDASFLQAFDQVYM